MRRSQLGRRILPICYKQWQRDDLRENTFPGCDVNKKRNIACVCTDLQYMINHLSLLQRLASGGLVGLGRASLCVQGLEVRGRKRSRVVGGLERVRCGGQALKVLAVVLVGLVVVSIEETRAY
jgi:hypothetical protein